MKIMTNKSIMIFVLCAVTFSFASCAGSTEDAKKTINIYGSTSVQPIAELMAEKYMENNIDIQVLVQGVGSTQGINAVNNGETEIGSSSRDLKPEEKSFGLTQQIIAYDCIAVIVNPANTVTDLTKDQVVKIYKGEITNWKDVGGVDKAIEVVNREEGSGTRSAFQEILKIEEMNTNSISFDSTGAVKSTIAGNDAAIGYISLGVLDDSVKSVSVDGVAANAENVKNKTYAIWRPFILLTKGELKPEVKAFIEYTKSDEAQQIVIDENYIPIDK